DVHTGEVSWIRCPQFHDRGASTAEEATALLREHLAAVGVYEVEPIVSEEAPERPESITGGWTREKVREVVREDMLRRCVVAEDIDDGPLLRFCVMPTRERGLKLELGRHWMLIIPSTTEKEIRQLVGLWCWDVQRGWKEGDTKTLPKTRQLKDELSGFVPAREAAERMGCTWRHVRLLCSQGKLRGARKVGRDWFIPRDALDEYTPGPMGFAAHPEKNPRRRKGGQEPSEEG
ncbi:MAG: excisionase family DNA-binding protein, partial [Synergistaceae bacterium]|nr:excisionase family DNA-binding protein [Synergistaceae bacterium]